MIKEGITEYSLGVNFSTFYDADVGHFHFVMLADNVAGDLSRASTGLGIQGGVQRRGEKT